MGKINEMKKSPVFPIFSSLVFFLMIVPSFSWSQLVLGQYEDEAPFRTWNSFFAVAAPALGRGETTFSSASDPSAALSNPALLASLPKISFTLNSSYHSASFFKYSLVNTGVASSSQNIWLNYYSLDFGGISLRFGDWAFGLNMALVEAYDRPSIDFQYSYQGKPYYHLNFDQSGNLKNIQFSLARKLFQHASAGLGFNYVFGDLKRDTIEDWVADGYTITDKKSQEFQGIFVNGGFFIEFTEKLSLAAIFRTPYVKKSKSKSFLQFLSPAGNSDIRIEATSDDKYKLPLVIGLGVSYKIKPKLGLASDLTYANWSQYTVKYFGENKERNFKSILKIGAGVEYLLAIKLSKQNFTIPLRVGVIHDPQPMKNPNSSYLYLTAGIGIHWNKFLLDGGMLIGSEKGSGNSLSGKKFALALSFEL